MANWSERLINLGADLGEGAIRQAEEFAKAINPDDPEASDDDPETVGLRGGSTGADQDPVVEIPERNPESLFWDPYAIIEQLGYKEKPSAITYGTLKAMVWKVPLIQGIMMTRINQVASFARPQKDLFQTGFRIKLREQDAKPSPADKKFIRKAEEMMLTTGVSNNPLGRDSLENFLKKFTRDSMTFDQGCFEIVKNRKGEPAQFWAVDSSTIRLADTPKSFYDEDDPEVIQTVQVYDNMVINEWDRSSMAFCLRNPTTDIRNYGYGVAEMEMIVTSVTAFLYGFDYNSRFFSQGSVAKGLLNIKGAINTKQLRAFRRQWHTMISGVENAWRSPVLNAEEVQWHNMQPTNRDMEFSAWIDFIIKLISAVYLIDPSEVGFKYGNTGQEKSMFESANKQKLMESKDKGLKPLLRFVGRQLTNYIVRPINPDFEFEFVGLESQTPDQLAELNTRRVKTTHTVNELRAEWDLDPLEFGDIILDPVYQAAMNAAQEQENVENGLSPDGSEQPDDPFGQEDFDALLDADGDEGDEGDEPPKPAQPPGVKKSLSGADDIVLELTV